MLRKSFTPKNRPTYRYLDTINAALVRAFVHNGIPESDITGPQSRPWTFACKGYAQPGGVMTLSSLTVSTPDPVLAQALGTMNGHDIHASPNTGDKLALGDARAKNRPWHTHPDQDEICITFASPFLLNRQPPYARTDAPFISTLAQVNVGHILKKASDKNARRCLDVSIAIDRLTLMTEGTPRWISFRKAGSKRVMVPGFHMPITLRGNPADIRFLLYAGIGAKTRQGFGCPTALL